MDDDTLMAYADGELDPATAAQVAAAAATDPGVAARIEMFRRTRAALAAHRRAPLLPEAMAERLAARIRSAQAPVAAPVAAVSAEPAAVPSGATVVPLPARRALVWPVALAASLALAVGLGMGMQLGAPGEAPARGATVAALDAPGLAQALATLPAGERTTLSDGTELAMVASFRAPDGALCREFETVRAEADTLVSVACHGDAGSSGPAWDVRFALAAAPDSGGYAPASSIEALEVWLEVTGMGDSLTLEDEAAALAGLAR
ncbi:MAG: hypothetical protein MUF73_15325 [Rhodobacteraceae bacterium]|jgi:anti-sigma factor RsiW|nr:hypothetical protein [Paracoccaceae bacterium]